MCVLFDFNQFIFTAAHAHFDSVFQTTFPVGVGMGIGEVVVVAMFFFRQNAAFDDRLTVDRIGTCLVECYRVKRGKHTNIRNDWNIVFGMAVAVRRNVDDQADVEVRATVDDSVGVFGNFVVKDVIGFIGAGFDRIFRAGTDAASTAYTFVVVDEGALFGVFAFSSAARAVFTGIVYKADGIVRTVFATFSAGNAKLGMYVWFAAAVHFHLAGAGAAAHAQIFEGAAKSGGFMTFKMVEGDDDVGIHDRTSDFGFLHIFPVDRHQCFVGALQAVGNDDMAAGGKGIVAVFISAVQMVQCIFAASDIQGVAVGQERLATSSLTRSTMTFA